MQRMNSSPFNINEAIDRFLILRSQKPAMDRVLEKIDDLSTGKVLHKHINSINDDLRVGDLVTSSLTEERIEKIFSGINTELDITRKYVEDWHRSYEILRKELNEQRFTRNYDKLLPVHHTEQALTDEDIGYLKGATQKFLDYKYPSLMLGGKSQFWIDFMIGAEPLYTYESHEYYDHLRQLIDSQNEIQKHRIKIIPPNNPRSFQSQMGLVLAWNFFHWINHGNAFTMLKVAADMVRPGGALLIQVPDIFPPELIHLNWQVGWPLLEIDDYQSGLEDVGFRLIDSRQNGVNTWALFKKEGVLTSYKVSPVFTGVR